MTTAPQFKRLSPLTPLVRGSLFFVAVLGGTWQMIANGELGPFALLLLAVLLIGLVYGTISWWLTKYWIEGDELRIDTGVISRQSRRIRIDRLQGIDIVQPLVARFFRLAELKMDVAGGGEAEASLAYLPHAEADDLKEMLLARRDAARHAITSETPLDQLPPPHPERLLARLDVGVLVGSLALSGETIAFALSGVAVGALGAIAGSFGAAVGLLPVVGGFAIILIRRLTGYYNFTVTDTAAGLQVRRGLFELSSQTIALGRVQGVVVSEPLLWRRFGWAKLDVSVAGSAGSDSDGKELSSTVFPVGPREEVLQLAQHCLRGLDLTAVPLTRPPERSKWVEPIGRHFAYAGLDERLLVSRSGWFSHKTNAVPHRRVQSLRVSQGPLMRRLRLATLYVDSPPGPVGVRMPLRDEQETRELLERAIALGRQARKGSASTPITDTIQ